MIIIIIIMILIIIIIIIMILIIIIIIIIDLCEPHECCHCGTEVNRKGLHGLSYRHSRDATTAMQN